MASLLVVFLGCGFKSVTILSVDNDIKDRFQGFKQKLAMRDLLEQGNVIFV